MAADGNCEALRAAIRGRFAVAERTLGGMNARDLALHLALHDEVFAPLLAPFSPSFTLRLEWRAPYENGYTVDIAADARDQATFDAVFFGAPVQSAMRAVKDRFVPAYRGDAPLAVREGRCDACLFSARHLPAADRIKGILTAHIEEHNSCFVCHEHNAAGIVCRGFYDAHPEIRGRSTLVGAHPTAAE